MPSENKMIITLGLDGTKLQKDLEFYVQRELVEETKKDIKKVLFKERPGYTRYYSQPTKSDLNDWIVEVVKETIAEHKDEIIQAAARELADSMRRSSKVREKFGELLEEEMKND